MSLGIINAVKSQTRGLTSRQRSYNWTPFFVTFSQNMLKFNESTKKKIDQAIIMVTFCYVLLNLNLQQSHTIILQAHI